MNPKPLRVTMKVQNNALYARRMEEGLSQVDLAEAVGISMGTYNSLENLRMSPVKEDGDVKDVAKKLMEYYGCEFSDLWPDIVLKVAVPVAVRELDAQELAHLFPNLETPLLPSPSEVYDQKEELEEITSAMERLRDRERDVLESRILRETPTKELAEKYGVSTCRIGEIEKRAIRKVQCIIHQRRAGSQSTLLMVILTRLRKEQQERWDERFDEQANCLRAALGTKDIAEHLSLDQKRTGKILKLLQERHQVDVVFGARTRKWALPSDQRKMIGG